ncbi:cyclic nucleotide-binding domain-containing protein [Archangium violaceum]|uniref:cyclic nucleotide-binding domain-containing protein n=1 Tax=Archangium violaceum TaxID=83451 RepID=UPI002B29AAA8|nr:cyclic nucleotide-binding domain-containing protein [Archangium violaceum]
MDQPRFIRELQNLLSADVEELDQAEKFRLVRERVDLFERSRSLLDLRLSIVPFVRGRRPIDEIRSPGLGSSEAIGLLGGPKKEEITFLYRLQRGPEPVASLPAGATLHATVQLLGPQGRAVFTLPAWSSREVQPTQLSSLTGTGPAAGTIPEAWALSLDVNEEFGKLRGGPRDPFGFESMFFERFRLQLDLVIDGVRAASDSFEFEIFDERGFGSLYERVATKLLPRDVERQLAAAGLKHGLSTTYHPWFPVLCIGVEKANLYMKAIRGDVAAQKKMLTDPAWLLRVGIYLELLTCLGIVETVKHEIDLLTPVERAIFEQSPRHAELRRRIDPKAWAAVWELRAMVLQRTPGMGEMPVGFPNLLRKRAATLGFLHAHHEDLKHAIHLAGPNLANAQESWHRVFRDAERAVLTMNEKAFPELGFLHDKVRGFVLWHQQGNLLGFKLLPSAITGLFGDQDGLFSSAARQYRASMNHVADWAVERGLMEYTGSECIPTSVSLVETYLAGNTKRLGRLQNRDGYEGTLEVCDLEEREERLPVESIASALERVGIFEVLTTDEVAALASSARPIVLGPHERIIVQGNKGSSLFILQEGGLEVIAKQDGKERVLAEIPPGAVVGEIAFLTGEPRTATVRATDSATVLEISAAHLKPLVEARPAILEQITALVAKRQSSDASEAQAGLLKRVSSAIFGSA